MQLEGHGECRRSFNWRLLRLVQHGFVRQQVVPAMAAEQVYSLTAVGSAHTAGMEDRFVTACLPVGTEAEQLSVLHSVELNHIRLSAARNGVLAGWVSEAEIRSENQLTNPPAYGKVYDALVTVRCNVGDITFALEYERTPKSQDEYRAIALKLQEERRVQIFLYLTTNHHLLRFVSWEFRTLDRRVYFGLVGDWHRQVLQLSVFSWRSADYKPLQAFLAA
jgi:hypothetical protein